MSAPALAMVLTTHHEDHTWEIPPLGALRHICILTKPDGPLNSLTLSLCGPNVISWHLQPYKIFTSCYACKAIFICCHPKNLCSSLFLLSLFVLFSTIKASFLLSDRSAFCSVSHPFHLLRNISYSNHFLISASPLSIIPGGT